MQYHYNLSVQNVVASGKFQVVPDNAIDLVKIASRNDKVEFNPERFPGAIFRYENPKASILLFGNGKYVITGLRKGSDADQVIEKLKKELHRYGTKVEDPIYTINNVVSSGNILDENNKGISIDLNQLAIIAENSMYEPEMFPGLILRIFDPKAVFLIFSSGSFVCSGAISYESSKKATEIMIKLVSESGCISLPIDLVKEEEDEEMMFL